MVIPFVAVAAVLAYYSHVSSQRVYLTERNFRLLEIASRGLVEEIANHERILSSLLNGLSKVEQQGRSTKDEELRCLQSLPGDNEYKKRVLGAKLCDLSTLKGVILDNLGAEYTEQTHNFEVTLKHEGKQSGFVLDFTSKDQTGSFWRIQAEIDVARLMQKLPSEDIFAETLLADSGGKVFYRKDSQQDVPDFHAIWYGIRYALFRESRKAGQKKMNGGQQQAELPAFNKIKFGQARYLVFAQGGKLPSSRSDGARSSKNSPDFLLIGIVPSRKFDVETQAISGNLLLLMIGFVLLAFCALPFLNLKSMGPTDRLSLADLLTLLIASFIGTALLTFGLVDFVTYQSAEKAFDERLRQAAEDLRENFHEDLSKARDQLKRFDAALAWCGNIDVGKDSPWHTSLQIVSQGGKEFVSLRNADRVCPKFKEPELSYSYVNDMFWVWPDGFHNVDWSRGEAEWAVVQLREREYVKRIWAGSALDSPDGQFWLQAVYSWTTGQNYAIVSMASTVKPRFSTDSKQPIVAALEMKMPSVMDPVVLPGFGFAVIDQSGTVLFHSDSRRNLRENFFEENEQNEELLWLVFHQVQNFADGQYRGTDRRFYVTQIPDIFPDDTAWSLVVYRDKDLLRIANLQALTIAVSLFLLYAALIHALFWLWVYQSFKNRRAGWMWPHASRNRDYQLIVLGNILLLCFFGLVMLQPAVPAMTKALLSVIIPPWGWWIMLVTLRKSHEADTEPSKTRVPLGYRWNYTLMIMTFLLVYGMLPAFGFLKIAFETEIGLLVKYAQVDLIQDGQWRREHMKVYCQESECEGSRDVYGNFYGNALSDFESYLCNEKEGMEPSWLDFAWVHTSLRDSLHHPVSIQTGGFIGKRGCDQSWLDQSETSSLKGKSAIAPSPPAVPGLLYWMLVFGGLFAVQIAQTVKAKGRKVGNIGLIGLLFLAGFLNFWPRITLQILVAALCLGLFAWLLSWLLDGISRFVAPHEFLLDFPTPLSGSSGYHEAESSRSDYTNTVRGKLEMLNPIAQEVFIGETDLTPELRAIGKKLLDDAAKMSAFKQIDDGGVAVEEILMEVLVAGEEHYATRWKSCSQTEKLALFHLAKNHFLHAENPELRRLLHKGLIVLDPDLRLMNESFRRFVLTMGEKEHLTKLEQQELPSGWGQIWRPIGLGLVVLAVFLILTQEEYRFPMVVFSLVIPIIVGLWPQLFRELKSEKNTTSQMKRIFVSYRRKDSGGDAGRLADHLRTRFGHDNVFLDVESIGPGQDFIQAIKSTLAKCDAVLVVIGREWLLTKNDAGSRRLDDQDDPVRLEIATALEGNVRVIPVLVRDATMPRSKDLPEELMTLANLNAHEITNARFQTDVNRLVEALTT